MTIGAGSDLGVATVPYRWGTHHEMQQLAAVDAAAGNTARILVGETADFGTVATGKIADLILLGADPEDDIANTRRIERVVKAGVWLDRRKHTGHPARGYIDAGLFELIESALQMVSCPVLVSPARSTNTKASP